MAQTLLPPPENHSRDPRHTIQFRWVKLISGIAIVTAVSSFLGHEWFDQGYSRVYEEISRQPGLIHERPYVVGEQWPVVILIAVTYGMLAWRYLGARLTGGLVLFFILLGTMQPECVIESMRPWRIGSAEVAVQGGLISGILAVAGLALVNVGTERKGKLTLKRAFGAMLAVALFLGGLKAWERHVRWELDGKWHGVETNPRHELSQEK